MADACVAGEVHEAGRGGGDQMGRGQCFIPFALRPYTNSLLAMGIGGASIFAVHEHPHFGRWSQAEAEADRFQLVLESLVASRAILVEDVMAVERKPEGERKSSFEFGTERG